MKHSTVLDEAGVASENVRSFPDGLTDGYFPTLTDLGQSTSASVEAQKSN